MLVCDEVGVSNTPSRVAPQVEFTSCPSESADRFFYYVGNIARDISGITRKSTDENRIGAADFLISLIACLFRQQNHAGKKAWMKTKGER